MLCRKFVCLCIIDSIILKIITKSHGKRSQAMNIETFKKSLKKQKSKAKLINLIGCDYKIKQINK